MMKQIVKTIAVSSRRFDVDEPEQAKTLHLLDASRTSIREALLQSEELAAEVYHLRREVIRLSKLVKIRERERDGANQAHKKRVVEANRLQRYNEKLEGWLEAENKPKKNKKNKNKKSKKKDKMAFAIAASPIDSDEDTD